MADLKSMKAIELGELDLLLDKVIALIEVSGDPMIIL